MQILGSPQRLFPASQRLQGPGQDGLVPEGLAGHIVRAISRVRDLGTLGSGVGMPPFRWGPGGGGRGL